MPMNRSAFGKQVKLANLTAKPMRAVKPGAKRLVKAKTPTKVKRGFSK